MNFFIQLFDVSNNSICAGQAITFENLSSNAENYAWNFGDGNLSFLEDPVKTYAEPGVYDVTLEVNNDNFCYDDITYYGVVEVFAVPVADFSTSQSAIGVLHGEVEFHNESVLADAYTWDFGDDFASIDADPVHTYSQSGQ